MTLSSLNVKAVTRLSGVPAHTLRAWERRYQAVVPARTETGRRAYTMEDVERLKALATLVSRGHAISSVAMLKGSELEELLQKTSGDARAATAGEAIPSLHEEVGAALDRALQALQSFDLERLGEELAQARRTIPPGTFALEFASPLLGEVGMLVARELVSVAQEHALSAILRNQIGQLLDELSTLEKKRKTVFAFGTPEGDLHEFGILLGAVLCARRGFHVKYLGANLPAREFADASKRLGADVLILGTSLTASEELKQPLQTYVAELESQLPKAAELWIGGQGPFNAASLKSTHPLRQIGTLEILDRTLEKTA